MEFRTRKMVMDADLNPAGSLFGGRALAWIDEEAAIFAYCQLKYPKGSFLVTKKMSTVIFQASAHKGDILEIGLQTNKVGTTSITVELVLRNKITQAVIVHIDEIVFVNVVEKDGVNIPTPHGMTLENLPEK